jgi:hypothetical protein
MTCPLSASLRQPWVGLRDSPVVLRSGVPGAPIVACVLLPRAAHREQPMKPIGFHVTMRLEQDINIAPSPTLRRKLARSVLTTARPFALYGFRWADSHGHTAVIGELETAKEMTRRIEIGLQRSLEPGIGFVRAHFKPMYDQWHLASTLVYVLGQNRHHGFAHDPHHDASNFPDLLGMRLRGAFTIDHVREHAPRVGRPEILAAVGIEDFDDREFVDGDIAEAGAAAACLEHLVGRSAEVVIAHRAVVAACRPHLSIAAIADRLQRSRRTIRRLAAASAPPSLVRAVRLQLVLRGRVRVDALTAAEAG